MKVLKAEAMGFCFGVRDALAVADSIEKPGEVTIHGELVHNPVVLNGLKLRGFPAASEVQRGIPETEQVLITAHGVSDRERSRLISAGKILIDTTCPLVGRVHRTAATLERSGYHVIVIGKPGHVEVRGIVEDLSSYTIVPDIDSVESYPHEKLGVVCQTTMPPDVVQQIRGIVVWQTTPSFS